MKIPIPIFFTLTILTVTIVNAQEPAEVAGTINQTEPVTAITSHLSDGTPSPPSPPRLAPELDIIKTLTKPIVREEPAPLPGMKAIRKTVTLTKHLIVEPIFPDAPPPLPPMKITEPAVLARMATMRANFCKTEIVYVSATVYDHHRTLVRWWPNGNRDKEMRAWSNLDFNLLSGFWTYTWQDREFALLMGLGNESTTTRRRVVSKNGRTYTPREIPEIPEIPTDGPGFVVTKGDATEPGALDIIIGLQELYQAEGVRLQAAYDGREKARIEREAYLRANPPQPQDLTTWISEPRRLDVPNDKTLSR